LLAAEPGNAEYVDIQESLEEVITLTEEMLATAGAEAAAEAGGATDNGAGGWGAGGGGGGDDGAATAEALMAAQTVRGAVCQASYDGEWFDAAIDSILPAGAYTRPLSSSK